MKKILWKIFKNKIISANVTKINYSIKEIFLFINVLSVVFLGLMIYSKLKCTPCKEKL